MYFSIKKVITAGEVGLLVIALIALFVVDIPLAQFFSDAPSVVKDFFRSFTDVGSVLHIPALLLAIAYCKYVSKDDVWLKRWLFVLAALVMVCIITHGLKFVLGRYRPSLYFREGLNGFLPFGSLFRGKTNSCPSGHTSNIICLSMTVATLFPRARYPLYITSFVIAFSRVAVTAHYFSDVLLGILVAIIGVRLVRNYMLKRGWLGPRFDSSEALMATI
jgi:membrane-associated phospholipid phosphatase